MRAVFALLAFMIFGLAAVADAVKFIRECNAKLIQDGHANPVSDLDGRFELSFQGFPVAVAASSSIQITMPQIEKFPLKFDAVNATVATVASGAEVAFTHAEGILSFILPEAVPVDGNVVITMTNMEVEASVASFFMNFAVKSENDAVLANDVILVFPVDIAAWGLVRREVTPFNVTAGSDFGLITLAMAPMPRAIPAGGAVEFSVPNSWAVQEHQLICSASRNKVQASAADITGLVGATSGKVITVPFPNGFAAQADGSVDTLRVFCNNAVKVSAAPEKYTSNGEYSSVYAIDASGDNIILDGIRVKFPDILAGAAPVKIVVQKVLLARDSLFSSSESDAFLETFARAVNLPRALLKLSKQFLSNTSIVKKSKFALRAHRLAKALADTKLNVETSISVPADQTAEDMVSNLTAASTALASAIQSDLGIAAVVEAPSVTEEDATCSNNVKDQLETDVDCGGSSCSACANGKTCSVDTDCFSGFCGKKGVCSTPSSASTASVSAAVAALVVAAAMFL